MKNNDAHDDSAPGNEPHSALYFGETRDYWWNADHLALVAQRLRLFDVRTLLDVGCGIGHWSRLLLPFCHPTADLVGVDREARWVEAATARCSLPERCRYQRADLRELPFADGSFGLVTCQTVLMHVADVRAALAEMTRVLASGGWLLVAEPNNLAGRAASLLADSGLAVETALEILRFQALCERGKAALGLGANSIGETLPSYLDRDQFDEIHVWQRDRSFLMIPPYQDAAQQAEVDEAREFADRNIWIWPKQETRRYYLAGVAAESQAGNVPGPSPAFETSWATAMTIERRRVERMARGELVECGGQLLYLVAARKRR